MGDATSSTSSGSDADPLDPCNHYYVTKWIKEDFKGDDFCRAMEEHLSALAGKHGVLEYTILYLIDVNDDLSSWHSNRLYLAASAAKKEKPILLVLYNLGGSIEAGYLISKTCRRLSSSKFVVAVPRKAKSAATLLALGAGEIHMGLVSELGPIDPQFNGLPALGMKNALEILSDLACKHPGASKMLSEYIQEKLDLGILGYFERINESAVQYAERLLDGRVFPKNKTAQELANHLVNYYKDHNFVIDFDESRALLGDGIVKQETNEYAFANAVYESFDFISFIASIMLGKEMDLVSGGDGKIVMLRDRRRASSQEPSSK